MSHTTRSEEVNAPAVDKNARDLDVRVTLSPVLARLIDEVRHEGTAVPFAYNRYHNRHNR
jgi:hypothetical protein